MYSGRAVECRGVWDAMLQACYAHLLRWTCDEWGGFTKGRPKQGPVGASEIKLRSHNKTREFRERPCWASCPKNVGKVVRRNSGSMISFNGGEKSLVEIVRQAENRKGYRCLVHEAAYARTSGTASCWWWYTRATLSFAWSRFSRPTVHLWVN